MLERPWFAGGTITIASVQGDGHYLHDDEAGFEDGTVDYLNLPAIETGLDHLERIGRDAVHSRVDDLTAWLLDALTGLRHVNGSPIVDILGPRDTSDRGGTITFLMRDRDGRPIDDRRIEELANREDISLRTGCFCNPGAGEIAHHLAAADMVKWFDRDQAMSFLELREQLLAEHDLLVAAVTDLRRCGDELRRRLPVHVLHAGLRRPHRRRDRRRRVRVRQLPDRPRLGVTRVSPAVQDACDWRASRAAGSWP